VPHEHKHDAKPPADEFTADLERDSAGHRSSSMEDLVQDIGAPLATPTEEQYVADPEAHRQHSRKGQAESPRELTLNQPEHKKHRDHD
jgi:hypothetical protein